MPQAPDNLRWVISLTTAPPAPSVPPHLRGRPVASQGLLWVGDRDEGNRYLHRALSVCNCQAATQREMSFLELQTMADHEFPHGRRYYIKSGYFKALADSEIERMVAALETVPSPLNQIELACLGGAAAASAQAKPRLETAAHPSSRTFSETGLTPPTMPRMSRGSANCL